MNSFHLIKENKLMTDLISDFFVFCGRLTLSVTLLIIIHICTLSETVHRGKQAAFISVSVVES